MAVAEAGGCWPVAVAEASGGAEAEAGDDLVTGHITNTRIITAEVGAEIGDTDHGTLAKTDITHVKKKGEEVL